ncbi:hypothetical protein [Shouchella clausii]|uniref:hypothetical protein n=1 Tax=Shouchella clausii TaxID=79880 RepID=UPI000BA788F0|nr:hypothetical protein [Shouchella clausii]PAD17460.1 hypothetical protein CHH73_08945 [Shouchella clausii]
MAFTVRKMEETDLLAVQALFARMQTKHPVTLEDPLIVVENDAGELIATVGLEKATIYGLLRTMVMDSAKMSSSALVEFIQMALAYAQTEGVETVFAASQGNATLFELLGFKRQETDAIPNEIKEMEHYQTVVGQDGVSIWAYVCSPFSS